MSWVVENSNIWPTSILYIKENDGGEKGCNGQDTNVKAKELGFKNIKHRTLKTTFNA